MNFAKFHNNCKTWQITIAKIAIAFLMFVVINDKFAITNIFKTFQNISNMSFDTVVYELVNIGKIVSFDHSLYIALGLLVCQCILVTGFIGFIKFFSIKTNVIEKSLCANAIENHCYDKITNVSSNIYLTYNKFIC